MQWFLFPLKWKIEKSFSHQFVLPVLRLEPVWDCTLACTAIARTWGVASEYVYFLSNFDWPVEMIFSTLAIMSKVLIFLNSKVGFSSSNILNWLFTSFKMVNAALAILSLESATMRPRLTEWFVFFLLNNTLQDAVTIRTDSGLFFRISRGQFSQISRNKVKRWGLELEMSRICTVLLWFGVQSLHQQVPTSVSTWWKMQILVTIVWSGPQLCRSIRGKVVRGSCLDRRLLVVDESCWAVRLFAFSWFGVVEAGVRLIVEVLVVWRHFSYFFRPAYFAHGSSYLCRFWSNWAENFTLWKIAKLLRHVDTDFPKSLNPNLWTDREGFYFY